MIKKTTNYELFKFRADNRAEITNAHIERLKQSILARNLLEFRPIIVNKQMEVLDGQHRLLAAKALGYEIYYQMNEELKAEDIISLNVAKPWGMSDYLNYYIKNGYNEYRKLQEFMKKHQITVKIALRLTIGNTQKEMDAYRRGEFKFVDEFSDIMDQCWETIHYIIRMNGTSHYTSSAKFWMALVKLVKHHNFDADKWRGNLEKMVDKVGPRITTKAFLELFMDIHNWRNNLKVNLLED